MTDIVTNYFRTRGHMSWSTVEQLTVRAGGSQVDEAFKICTSWRGSHPTRTPVLTINPEGGITGA